MADAASPSAHDEQPLEPVWPPALAVAAFALGMSTSLAFSATDAMPLARWAKLAMTLQSLISVTVIGLVIARAVNVFT